MRLACTCHGHEPQHSGHHHAHAHLHPHPHTDAHHTHPACIAVCVSESNVSVSTLKADLKSLTHWASTTRMRVRGVKAVGLIMSVATCHVEWAVNTRTCTQSVQESNSKSMEWEYQLSPTDRMIQL